MTTESNVTVMFAVPVAFAFQIISPKFCIVTVALLTPGVSTVISVCELGTLATVHRFCAPHPDDPGIRILLPGARLVGKKP